MRVVLLLLLLGSSLLSITEARAQYGPPEDRFPEHRKHGPTHADSTRTLAGARQIWGHAGAFWVGAPGSMQSRYGTGLCGGLSADRRFFDHVALRARFDFQDLPSKVPTNVYINTGNANSSSYGHGWLVSSLAGVAIRPWSHVWLDGQAGAGYFDSGFPPGNIGNPLTGTVDSLRTRSGWCLVWSASMRYEFKPTLRDRMLAEVQFQQMDRDGTRLQFWAARVGYRAF